MSIMAIPVDECYERGLIYKTEGRYDEAIGEFQALLAGEPRHALARMELGLVYGFQGLFDESIEELARAVTLAPESVLVRLNYARSLCMLGMSDEARIEFEAVLERDPDNEEALKNLSFL